MKNIGLMRIVVIATAIAFLMSKSASAQFDPRQPLNILIAAFQRCGPPQAYQMLSPYLFQVVAQQTGGRGCYQEIASAGPVTQMQVIQSQQFPIGPLYVIRVDHSSGIKADWFVGFNRVTGQVEYLNFQNAQSITPTIERGPSPTEGGPSTPPVDRGGSGEGCDLYPAMCG